VVGKNEMDIILFLVIAILFLSLAALELFFIRRWQGAWRILSALPGIALAIVILNIGIGIMRDRTAHNLWPLEIAVWSAGGLVFLGVLSLVRRLIRGPAGKQ